MTSILSNLPQRLKWIAIENDWFESDTGDVTLLNDPDLGWTLLDSRQMPPTFLGQFSTHQQALGHLSYT